MPNPWDNVAATSTTSSVPATTVPTQNPWSRLPETRIETKTAATSGGGNPWNAMSGAASGIESGAANVGSALTRALDAQRWALNKAITGEADPDKQMENLRRGVGVEGAYEAAGKIPVIGHAAQGLADAVLGGATDPLTYETLGMGPAFRALGIAGKVAPLAMKAVNATPLGRALYDFTHWAGEIERERGLATGNFLRGASEQAASTGSVTQARMLHYFGNVVKSLSKEDKVNVGKALNGEIEREALTPAQSRAYNQLRRLTEYDYGQRSQVAKRVNFLTLSRNFGLNAEDRDALWKAIQDDKEPEVPKPERRIKLRGPGSEVKYRTKVPGAQPAPKIDWQAVYQKAFEGLTPEERHAVQEAAGRGYVEDGLAPKLIERLRTLKEAGAASLEDVRAGLGDVPKITPKRPYTLPFANAEQISRAERLRDAYHLVQAEVEQMLPRRENYMPWTHYEKEAAEGTEKRAYNPLERGDPRTEQREEVKVTTPGQLQRGFEAMSANTGRQVEKGALHEALGEFVDDPKIKALFEQMIKATGAKRTNWERVKDGWLAMVGYPRAATVSLTPRHAVNIADLAANTVPLDAQPKFFADSMALAKKLVAANPREYAKLTEEGRKLGAVPGNFMERKAFFQEGPMSKVPGLSKLAAFNNKLVWAIDTAMKQEYAKIIVQRGEAQGLEAGGLASKRLVDYQNTSQMIKALRYVAPFGTFRGSIPGAVLGGVARNPARAAFLSRASGQVMYGDQNPAHTQKWYGPTSDVGFGFNEPRRYLRATLGAPVQGALTAGQQFLAGELGQAAPSGRSKYAATVKERERAYFTYGRNTDLIWLMNAAAAGIPEAQAVISALGFGIFPPRHPEQSVPERAVKELLRQSTGIGSE